MRQFPSLFIVLFFSIVTSGLAFGSEARARKDTSEAASFPKMCPKNHRAVVRFLLIGLRPWKEDTPEVEKACWVECGKGRFARIFCNSCKTSLRASEDGKCVWVENPPRLQAWLESPAFEEVIH